MYSTFYMYTYYSYSTVTDCHGNPIVGLFPKHQYFVLVSAGKFWVSAPARQAQPALLHLLKCALEEHQHWFGFLDVHPSRCVCSICTVYIYI